MLQNYNKYNVLKVFLSFPTENFRLREIARIARLSLPSVINYLNEFQKEGLIKKQIKRGIPFYTAMRDNEKFILYKKISIIFELDNSGIVDYLWNAVAPQAIILYGSFAKGESTEVSDIDVFVLGKEKKLAIEKYEKLLNGKFHILFKKSFHELPKELRNNILNGIILKGYLKAF